MSGAVREIADPFVAAAPSGARVRTRLRVSAEDEAVLLAAGKHLGSLAGADLAARCAEGRLDAKGRAESRRERKRALTAGSSSRWAGAITRTSEDQWQLADRNLRAEKASLQARVRKVETRLKIPAGTRQGRIRGYADPAERHAKTIRLKSLNARLAEVERRLEAGAVSVVRGGRALLRKRASLAAAGLTEDQWRGGWESARLFLSADGESGKPWGNETIRVNYDEGWLELKLPAPLAHLANQPHGRYRLSCEITFPHCGGDAAAQAASGAIRYDISRNPALGRWYIDASWKIPPRPVPTLDDLTAGPVIAVDVNAGHLAVTAVAPDGNVLGVPFTVGLDLAGLATSTRDGRVRTAITRLITTAEEHGARAIVIEDLDFAEARAEGRERAGSRPSRGKRGRVFRRAVAGIPDGPFPRQAGPDDRQRRTVRRCYRSGVYKPLGRGLLASPAAAASPRSYRSPRCGAGHRETRTRPPGQESREREPYRPRGRGTASPDANPETPGGQALTQEASRPTRPPAAARR